MEFIKNNFLSVIILGLVLILFFNKGKEVSKKDIEIIRDTTWIHKDSTIYSKSTVVKTVSVPYEKRIIEYIPDTNYNKLVRQYNTLVDKYLIVKMYKDSIKIDSIGYVHINDTISSNTLQGRSYTYNIKHPIINNYIPLKTKNQLYYGGGVGGNPIEIVNNIYAGVLLKTKRDRIVGINIGLNSKGLVNYGLSSYWKISLKK
jgi:hypothetical protein